MAPDIFPPRLVGAYLNKDKGLFYRQGDTPNIYFERISSKKDFSTLRLLQKQILSSAKADATRRTTSVHPLRLNGTESFRFDSSDERYFVFLEKYAEDALKELSKSRDDKIIGKIQNYQSSRGTLVLSSFFELMDVFKEQGISENKEKKHKYPVHGLMYGSSASLPNDIYGRIEEAGNSILSALVNHLDSAAESLVFSIDFFLSTHGSVYVGRDVHEHQIGMGLQYMLEVDDSSKYYDELTNLIHRRSDGKHVNLEYDQTLCTTDKVLKMELDALVVNLKKRGFLVSKNDASTMHLPYTVRLFGGSYGYPSKAVSRLTDDRGLIDSMLIEKKDELSNIGVLVPYSYKSNAQELVSTPEKIIENIGPDVFIHPLVHHYFKPFQINLSSALSIGSAKEILSSLRTPLENIPLLVTERAPNFIKYGDKEYPHEIRAYFIPER